MTVMSLAFGVSCDPYQQKPLGVLCVLFNVSSESTGWLLGIWAWVPATSASGREHATVVPSVEPSFNSELYDACANLSILDCLYLSLSSIVNYSYLSLGGNTSNKSSVQEQFVLSITINFRDLPAMLGLVSFAAFVSILDLDICCAAGLASENSVLAATYLPGVGTFGVSTNFFNSIALPFDPGTWYFYFVISSHRRPLVHTLGGRTCL